MADTKLTEEQVTNLPTLLRSDASLDAKVQYVTNIKSGIKQHNVPDNLVPQLFDGLRAAAASQHAALLTAGFTALNHLLTRMSRQDPRALGKEAPRTLPLVVDKMGDHKDKFRALASQSATTLYHVAPAEVERLIRNSAMAGKNPRAKETALQWLLEMHKDHGLQFRGYVPTLMELLEDADGMVRDAAKHTVIELFRTAPNTAKSDLKRQLKNFKVRPAIEQAIVKELAPTNVRSETPAAEHASAAPSAKSSQLSASVSSLPTDRPQTPFLDPRTETVEPTYVNTNRELDDILKGMAWYFEGRESEQNWLKREESIVTLRKLLAGNAVSDFHDTVVAGLRALLDGIIKAITSLRTSLSKEGCVLVQDMAVKLGPAMDPMVELLMQTFVKLAAATKKISSQLANVTVDMIVGRVTYTPRLLQHLWMACQDKNVQPRTYAPGWLITVMRKEQHHKSHFEHHGGVDVLEKCLKKGLADANPGVREKMRATYWFFHGIWPARADAIMADLDGTAQKLLNKDPHNPNASQKADPPARPGLGLSRSTMSSKPSLRETMMAQKKAALAVKNNLPARPGSAMAHISSPQKTTRNAPSSAAAADPKPAVRTRQEHTVSVKAGGMSVAPMRPTRRRPEPPARPATAGPYSMRDRAGSIEAESPETIKAKAKNVPAQRPRETTPRRGAPRTRPGHASHASESSVISPAKGPGMSRVTPSGSPAKPRTSQAPLTSSNSPKIIRSPPKATQSVVEPDDPAPVITSPQLVQLHEPEPHVEEPVQPSAEEPPEAPQQPIEPAMEEASEQPMLNTSQEVEQEPENAPVQEQQPSPRPVVPEIHLDSEPEDDHAVKPLEVYDDPFTEKQSSPAKTATPRILEERSANEDAATLQKPSPGLADSPSIAADTAAESPEKARQNLRLLDSGISKIKTKTLEVHGFRKLQSLLRDGRTAFDDDKFESLLLGLFQYLEDPLPETSPEKVQDVKAQILATIKLLLRTERPRFGGFVSRGLEALLQTRSAYDGRAHIVSGLELLASELVTLGSTSEIVLVLVRWLSASSDATPEGARSLGTGLHVLKEMMDRRPTYRPTDGELSQLARLAGGCLDSADSGVRMGAVQLCVALHDRVGEAPFWRAVEGVKDDPKSLITYYIVKKQREQPNPTAVS